MRPGRLRAAWVTAAAVTALAVPHPARAAPDQDTIVADEFTLVSQDYALVPDQVARFHFAVPDPDGTLAAAAAGTGDPANPVTGQVTVRVHGRVDDRRELAAILAGGLPVISDSTTFDLAGALVLEADGTAALDLAVPTVTDDDGDGLTLARPGIYLLNVTVRLDGGRTWRARTFVRRLPAQPSTNPPLGIAVIAALDDPGPAPSDAALADHRLQLEALARYGDTTTAPLSVAFPPALDVVLDGDELLRAEVADALTHAEVLSLPQLTLDPSAAVAVDEMTRFGTEIRLGEDTIGRLFPGTAARRSAWLVGDPLSGPAAAALRDPLGFRLLVLDQATYTELPGTIGGYLDPQRLVAVSPGTGQEDLAAAVVDPVGQLLAGDGRAPVPTAVELLTRLLVARDDIGPRDRRTAVLALDDFGLPDATVVAALATLVAQQPDVGFVTLSEVPSRTDAMRVGDDVTRVELPATAGPDLTGRLARIELVRVGTESAGSMLPTTEQRDAWQRELDGLVSTGLSDEEVDATLDRITAEVYAVLASVEPPEPLTFTLTGRDSELRINVRNNADDERVVRVRPSSPKLRFPDGDQVTTLAPGNNEIVIRVEARSNGRSSVEIQLLTPVFDQPLGRPAVLEARVNALTGLGPVVTGFAVLLLGSWWFSHYRRRRKQRLADATPVAGIPRTEAMSFDAAEASVVPPAGPDDTDSLSDL